MSPCVWSARSAGARAIPSRPLKARHIAFFLMAQILSDVVRESSQLVPPLAACSWNPSEKVFLRVVSARGLAADGQQHRGQGEGGDLDVEAEPAAGRGGTGVDRHPRDRAR